MDSKIVNRELRKNIRPLLKTYAFDKFTDRNSWRYSGERIDVINFQSFNSYEAERIGCTTFSFMVNLGCYLTYIPNEFSIEEKDGHLRPQESECQFRSILNRTYKVWFKKDKELWYLDKNGKNLEKAIEDVKEQIVSVAIPWFNMLHDDEKVLSILREEQEDMHLLWGFGNDPSPLRSLLTGFVSLKMGKNEEAKAKIQEAIESGCYNQIKVELVRTISAL